MKKPRRVTTRRCSRPGWPLEALRGEKTVAEIAARRGVLPNEITTSKSQLLKNAAAIFGGNAIAEDGRERIRELHEKIGELAVEREFLSRRAPEVPRPGRRAMIERGSGVPVTRQPELLGRSRSSVYYTPRPVPERDLVLMRRMAIEALHRRPRTSLSARGAAICPYLLADLPIERPNQVWASDITYLPMAHGFLYLAAILDVGSRKVLAFRLSSTLTADFCVEALAKFGAPEIFNTDQGSQFTSDEWIKVPKEAGVAISMHGKGRHGYTNDTEARTALTRYFSFYNARRSHQALDYGTPDEVYFDALAASTPIAASVMKSKLRFAGLLPPAAADRGSGERLTQTKDISIINRCGRSTYPNEKSIRRSGPPLCRRVSLQRY